MDAWYLITLLGEPELWMILAGVFIILYLIVRKSWPESRFRGPLKAFVLVFVPSIFLALGIVHLSKVSFQVPRACTPCPGEGCNPYCLGDSSFPSGHATSIFVAASAFFLASGRRRWLFVLVPVALLVAGSRVILGVHTALDVAVGAVLGIAVAVLVWRLEKGLRKR